jgi:ADP-ribose pyrophosphatase YjhB (NUDIX family)
METDGPRHSVSVSAVIVDDEGRILAIPTGDNDHWEPPGGVLELDESILDGLVREVHEETGLIVTPDRLTGVYKNMLRGIVALVFRCRITYGKAAATAESYECAWLSRSDVVERMAEAYATRVMDALDSETPPVRTHDGERLTEAR